MEELKDGEALLKPPCCGTLDVAHESKEPVTVNGNLPTQASKPAVNSAQEHNDKKEKKVYTPEQLLRFAAIPCREFVSTGKCKWAKCRFKHN
jgi:hypothetical protein